MRYLFIVLIFYGHNIQAQPRTKSGNNIFHRMDKAKREHAARRRIEQQTPKPKGKPPYVDLVISGTALFPKAVYSGVQYNIGNYDVKSAGLGQIGIDLMVNPKQRHVFASIITRIGYTSFKIHEAGTTIYQSNTYYGSGIHGGLIGFALNYMIRPEAETNILLSLSGMAGFRIVPDGYLPGTPYYIVQGRGGMRFNRRIGFGITASYTPILTFGSTAYTSHAERTFRCIGLGAELRISLGENR